MGSPDLRFLTTLHPAAGPIAGQPCPIAFTEHGQFLEVRAAPGAAGERHGLGMFVEDDLVISWGPKSKVEIGVYARLRDTLTGTWVPPDARGDDMSICGKELSKAISDSEFEITEARAIDGSTYTGRVSIEPMNAGDRDFPRPVNMTWRLADGDFASFAIDYGVAAFAIFSFEPAEWHAISVYEPQPDGSYAGFILERGQTTLAREVISIDRG